MITYQRYISEAFVRGSWLEDLLDQEVEERVEGAEVGGRDGDEDDRDRGRLDQRVAVGPLDFLQLGPAGGEEADDAAALALGAAPVSASWRAARSRGASARRACAFPLPSRPSPRRGARRGAASARRGSRGSASEAPAAIPASTASISAMSPETGTWVSCWARDSAPRSSPERFCSSASRARRSALRCARVLAIGGYRVSLCGGVVAAPAAELAQLDPVRRVAPGLVGLVIAPLAVFASQRHRDADISASHLLPRYGPRYKENPGPKREADEG